MSSSLLARPANRERWPTEKDAVISLIWRRARPTRERNGGSIARATLGVWGKALAARIPDEIAKAAGFAADDRIKVSGQRGEIVIRRSPASALAEMFAGKSPEEWRALYAGSDPWGPDVGREIVEP